MKNSDFITGRVPITKEEVRAVSIMKLDLVNAKRFIDVGAGTGSVSVEAAYNYPNLEVISIERNDDALDLINKNVEKFNLKNVEVIKAYILLMLLILYLQDQPQRNVFYLSYYSLPFSQDII